MKIIDTEEYLYHVTTEEHIDSILNNGLIPYWVGGMPTRSEPKIICLTNIRHVKGVAGDGQREIILRINKKGLELKCFYKDYSHTAYIGMRGNYDESDIIDYMFIEHGTIGYRCLILPEFIQIVES
jgi:hypothetical protein